MTSFGESERDRPDRSALLAFRAALGQSLADVDDADAAEDGSERR